MTELEAQSIYTAASQRSQTLHTGVQQSSDPPGTDDSIIHTKVLSPGMIEWGW